MYVRQQDSWFNMNKGNSGNIRTLHYCPLHYIHQRICGVETFFFLIPVTVRASGDPPLTALVISPFLGSSRSPVSTTDVVIHYGISFMDLR